MLCAAYDYDHEVAHPLMSQLPPVLHVPAGMPGDDGGVAATLRLLALELGGRPPGSRAAVGRLIDVMLIHAMRAWLRMQTDDATDGWLLALRDPVVAQAMNAIHQRPGEPWTIESLAREVSVSRATLARRFGHLVGETPPEYLTRWRMDLAAPRLRDTDDTVAAIAAAVGYRSEYSFSRAFARHRGLAPGRYRRQARAGPRRPMTARRGRNSDRTGCLVCRHLQRPPGPDAPRPAGRPARGDIGVRGRLCSVTCSSRGEAERSETHLAIPADRGCCRECSGSR